MTDGNMNSMGYWFLLLQEAGLPVPKTLFVSMWSQAEYQASVIMSRDPLGGEPIEPAAFCKALTQSARASGSPAFLRTGHTFGKYN